MRRRVSTTDDQAKGTALELAYLIDALDRKDPEDGPYASYEVPAEEWAVLVQKARLLISHEKSKEVAF